ncbi:hypothetical protein [Microbacterium thalassium]|uniref:Uncharacterized protein n=1 Tax=Microbacterium thalassium TaxID=362649 RepID=A0A7X0KVA4_9MICO|nr:hypothetical protein [Microbacterium thalassium]MBB6392026.1 hypothetical protein [Microbacterium thalassium]GLK25014.1 hypothetical protein GCM10017607_23320 [Microbacterium thalassium]
MNTPEQPASPPLTRKQLRELRNTGATPIVSAVATEEPAEPEAPAAEAAPAATPPAVPPVPPLPRAASPAPIAEPPAPDSSVDLGVAPLTRRQARQQERIRTASVPVITPEVAAAHTAANAAPPASQAPAAEPAAPAVAPEQPFAVAEEPAPEAPPQTEPFTALGIGEPSEPIVQPQQPQPEPAGERTVNPRLGSALAASGAAADVPPSFDQLLSPSSSGSSSTPNALILSQTPSAAPLSAPVTAAGDVIVTGTFNLPDGLGSTGHATGTADGKEVDAVLVDGEIPAHSSPTPIAASSAVSTSKAAGEVISPPTPEQGSRLMMVLAITAGVLALALVGVLILAFVTGVFS